MIMANETKPVPAASASKAGTTTKPAEKKPRKPPVRKVLKPLDFSQIEIKAATPEVMKAFRRTKGPRDAEQTAVDDLIRRAHERWVAAGRPQSWLDSPGLHIRVPLDQFETVETRARRAGSYFDLAIRFSNRVDKDGYAEVVLVAKDKPVKDDESDGVETA
jgi:hypothetical protein